MSTWNNAPFGMFKEPRSRAGQAHVTIMNEAMPLLPYPARERELPHADLLTAEAFDAHTSSLAAESQWAAVRAQVAQKRRLSVAVLGVSATAGGGAGDDWDLLDLDPNITGVARAGREKSWTRRLADYLADALDVPVHVSVWFKNAVNAEYYAHCTSTFLPSHPPHLVLLEFTPNIWGGNPSKVVQLVSLLLSHGGYVAVTWRSRGGHVADTWRTRGGHVADTWRLRGCQKAATSVIRLLHGCCRWSSRSTARRPAPS